MGKTLLKHLHLLFALLLSPALLMGSFTPTLADGGKLFFTAIVERDDQNRAQIVLKWGPLEGEIPTEIISFKLYRSMKGAPHQLLVEIPYQLASPSALAIHIDNDLTFRTDSLINALSLISESRDEKQLAPSSAVKFLLSLLDPSAKDHDPFMVMLLGRAHLSASIAQGLAFIDNTVDDTADYQYLLTAVTASGESLPIGHTGNVNPSLATIIPAPTGLDQVRLSRCSALGGGRDDNQINFTWNVPDSPQDLGLKAITYGYELFWSATDLGPVDFRSTLPTELHRVNQEPVVAAGQPLPEGPDSYLAKDNAANHTEGPAWKRGQSFFYYLAARDIAGHYCQPVNPVELTVTDAMPPRGVWNAHSREIKDPFDNTTPRLALVWDAPTATNFTRYYGGNRTICSADTEEICWVGSDQSCTNDTPRCADLAVDHYRILRFASPAEAAAWGVDTDGDGWPDITENDPLNNTDSCDPDVHPAGISVPWQAADVPTAWIATISPSDAFALPDPNETHRQISYIDYDMTDDNKVYWYKVIAVDREGNQSPLSAPLRGVLYDRSQPEPVATMYRESCEYFTAQSSDCNTTPQVDDIFILQDTTGNAVSYKFFQQCGVLKDTTSLQLLASGLLDKEGTRIKLGDLPQNLATINKCLILPCAEREQLFIIRFYDADGKILAGTDPFPITRICEFNGCVTLNNSECTPKEINDDYPIANDPFKVCVDLEAGQSAKIYYQTETGMSAFHSFNTAISNGKICHDINDFRGLTPADICLGVRVFSENHVGSRMLNLGCLELHAMDNQPPPPPLLDPVQAAENESGETFDLHWSMQAAGIGSYILKITNEGATRYESLWNVAKDDSGRYLYSHQLTPADMNKELCFQLRALSTDMRASEWSIEQCGTWRLGEPVNLGWPPVSEPDDGGDIGAFFMSTSDDKQAVLVLSDDLTSQFTQFSSCVEQIPACYIKADGIACLRDSAFQFSNCPACSILRGKILTDTFIVYRQEQGHDFVQVSPLIEGFHCRTDNKGEMLDSLQDPFVTLLNVNAITVRGVADPEGVGGGVRILFKDRYPFKVNRTIRYKLVSINPDTGEPDKIFTSNWVNMW